MDDGRFTGPFPIALFRLCLGGFLHFNNTTPPTGKSSAPWTSPTNTRLKVFETINRSLSEINETVRGIFGTPASSPARKPCICG